MAKGPDLARRRRALRLGALAEYLAAALLLAKGYRIEGMRYRVGAGEIDIIARKGDLIAFVEVKARRDLETALASVGGKTQARIKAASRIWLSNRRDFASLSWRYDIIAVKLPFSLKHFADAF